MNQVQEGLVEDRTLSMMSYEDWRPKLTPEIIQYLHGLQNALPSNFNANIQSMSKEQLASFQGTTMGTDYDFIAGLIGRM